MAARRPETVVLLADEADANSRIEHRTFERALILGPAVIALLGNVSFLSGSFAGHPDSMFIEVPDNTIVQGVIGLQDVTFRDCRFENIAFIGPREMLDRIRNDIGPAPSVTPPPQPEGAG